MFLCNLFSYLCIMERFIIDESFTKDGWVCTDQKTGLICHFKIGEFDDTRRFAFQHGVDKPDVPTAEKTWKEMHDWLKENHPEKIS